MWFWAMHPSHHVANKESFKCNFDNFNINDDSCHTFEDTWGPQSSQDIGLNNHDSQHFQLTRGKYTCMGKKNYIRKEKEKERKLLDIQGEVLANGVITLPE